MTHRSPRIAEFLVCHGTRLSSTVASSSVSTATTLRNSPSLDPSTFKTLSFYRFHTLAKEELGPWREQLLDDLKQWHIVGRIYLSTEGINAQLSCPEKYVDALRTYCSTVIKPRLGDTLMDLNLGTEHGQRAFRALHVRIRKQLVADGLDPTSYNLSNQPSHLSPAEWHKKLAEYKAKHGKDPVLIDMRNQYESHIGYFEGATRPDVDTFRGSIKAMNEIVKDVPRNQEVFMYCTGGIRCSKAGAILQSASGFETVHLVEGGVTAYGRWIQGQEEKSLFKGKNFTFDARLGETITDEVFGKYRTQTHEHFKPDGPIMIDGVRAYVKEGEKNMRSDIERVVVGKSGVMCEHKYNRRIRAFEVLGEPGQVLEEWAKAGRELPPTTATI
ncbi:Rhodanese-like domain-containing protein [Phycomyces blakesleeanus]|uniref:Rhodanese-like domain-containing protein n=1 Tax=Phycomyces blakesleeanus TaxID=4837 RepID=A0ABR3BAC2_PHYBL